jgi:hypothetical protein
VTVRRRSRGISAEALIARLPDELSRSGHADESEFWSHASAVRRWIDYQAPGAPDDLVRPVMQAAGLTMANLFKVRLGVTA